MLPRAHFFCFPLGVTDYTLAPEDRVKRRDMMDDPKKQKAAEEQHHIEKTKFLTGVRYHLFIILKFC